MRFCWPQDTDFRRVVLDAEPQRCARCAGPLHVCAHRLHRIHTLQGPTELCCRLKHCADPACASRPTTISPSTELALALPGWLVGWDVSCFIGHRRFARHWSVPQIRHELAGTCKVRLPDDAIRLYLRRYQAMVAARQQDPGLSRLACRDAAALWSSIGGLQPEKGHETLYAVRELDAGRVWLAEALLSSNADEVRRLLARAREMAAALGKPVRLWLPDKQDAFVKGIAAEFPGVPRRYCSNHFLRDLAKPAMEADSRAKVQRRKKVRGLRGIERAVLRARPAGPEALAASPDPAGQVVLDYCCAVRGILDEGQGGPLRPPGLRMAQALGEARASLGRALALGRAGPWRRRGPNGSRSGSESRRSRRWPRSWCRRRAGWRSGAPGMGGWRGSTKSRGRVPRAAGEGDEGVAGGAVLGSRGQGRGGRAVGQPGAGEVVPPAQRGTSGGCAAGATPGCASCRRGRPCCWRSTPAGPAPSRSPRRTCCPAATPRSRPIRSRPSGAARSCARPAPPKTADPPRRVRAEVRLASYRVVAKKERSAGASPPLLGQTLS